ncbi:unnamed protein product [Penicillium olsonii]|nr:unnamed protein product [Penicillium olsonii]
MAITAGYIMPAVRSLSTQDYTYGLSQESACMRQSPSIPQNEVDHVPSKEISTDSNLTEREPSAATRAPPEILLQIFSLLSPREFNSARHTCSRWMRVSLNERLIGRMLKSAGWWNAWLQDHSQPCVSGRDESDVWRMSRRLTTESLLSGRKSKSRPRDRAFVKSAVIDFSALVTTSRKSRAIAPGSKEEIKEATSTFSPSSCSNYLLVTTGCNIHVFRLLGRRIQTKSDSRDADLELITCITCPFDVVATAIDASTPKLTIAALLSNRAGMYCKINLSSSSPKLEIPHLFYDICSEATPPKTIALSPGRALVAFGSVSGIELHTLHKERDELRKPFTLPQPSEVLHFLPSTAEAPDELRLISSLSGPPPKCKCPPTQPKDQFHFLADVQSFSRHRIPHTPSRSLIRATHCHHYRAVPINDGLHMTFVEPRSNLLCIGSDAPIGGLTSLTRAFVCIPPFASSKSENFRAPSSFAAASDLRWGLRVAAVYANRLVLYSIPGDLFSIVRRERERQVNGVMGDSDLSRDLCAEAGAYMETLDAYRSTAMRWPLQVRGREIGLVHGAVELSVQCEGGGVRVWAFGKSGTAEVFDLDAGDLKGMSFVVDEDGVKEGKKEAVKDGAVELSRKRKFEEDVAFAGKYGPKKGRHCRDGDHHPVRRSSSFAACIIDFKMPDMD